MATIVAPVAPVNIAEATAPASVPWKFWDLAKAIAAVIILTLLAGIPAVLIADSLLESGQEYKDDATAFTIVLIPSMVLVEVFLLAAAWWFGPRKYKVSWATLGLGKPDGVAWWFAGAVGFAGLAIIYGFVGAAWLVGIEEPTQDEIFDNPGPFIVVAIGAILLAPVIEEIFFRGFIFGWLRGHLGWVAAAAVSGVLFSVGHLSLFAVLPFTVIGILFAWSYQRTGSIRPGMIAHFMINVVSVGIGLASSGAF